MSEFENDPKKTDLENKAFNMQDDGEINSIINSLLANFEAFKHANNERLDALEKRKSDVLLDEKLARINDAMDAQQDVIEALRLKASRPGLALETHQAMRGDFEHKSAFDSYMRSGQETGLRALEQKALSAGSNPDGGYLVSSDMEVEIGRRLVENSPIRALATVRQVSSSVFKKPFSITGPQVGWVGETDSRPQTSSQTLSELVYPTMELYAMPAATPTLLDDAAVNIDEWIADEVQTAFAEQETDAFINGDGVNKPKGFLQATQVSENTWSWGKIGYKATGVDGALPTVDESDVLIDLIYALKAGYRQNAHWIMNRGTQSQLRKLKDADGNYLWQPSQRSDGLASFMGFGLVEAEDMPDIGTNTTPIAFGDFRRGYLIVDRLGVNVLRDPFSAKPYVLFYTTKRVGGGVQDFDAIKLLKFSAS